MLQFVSISVGQSFSQKRRHTEGFSPAFPGPLNLRPGFGTLLVSINMIVGTGVDIAETVRIEQVLNRHGERFSGRLFTPQEIAYCEKFKNKAERYAARFAAKEAAFKALGTGWREGVRWLDVEVTHQLSGKPELALYGRAQELARQLRVTRTALSISHADRYVVAQVIFESDGEP
jgi:holo-[acyl-carrier protein] synthase